MRFAFVALAYASLAACTPAVVATETLPSSVEPLLTLPAEASFPLVRQDLLATAADRVGPARLEEARAATTYLIVKRFAGMLPPPPPGAVTTLPTPPAALLVKRVEGWMVATPDGWRPAAPDAAAEIDSILANAAFWNEPAYTPPCPDFGASLLLLKVPGNTETVRNSTCMSQASRLVEAALRA